MHIKLKWLVTCALVSLISAPLIAVQADIKTCSNHVVPESGRINLPYTIGLSDETKLTFENPHAKSSDIKVDYLPYISPMFTRKFILEQPDYPYNATLALLLGGGETPPKTFYVISPDWEYNNSTKQTQQCPGKYRATSKETTYCVRYTKSSSAVITVSVPKADLSSANPAVLVDLNGRPLCNCAFEPHWLKLTIGLNKKNQPTITCNSST